MLLGRDGSGGCETPPRVVLVPLSTACESFPMDPNLRRASERDVEDIRTVGSLTWPSTYDFAGADYVADGLSRWWSDEAIRQSIANTDYWLAEVSGQIVGVANIDLRQSPPVIWVLYVLPDFQGQGIGSALLRHLVDSVAGEVQSVGLEYIDGNESAGKFYARHGFAEVRREPNERSDWPDQIWVERSTSA